MEQEAILTRVKTVVHETFGAPAEALSGRTTARDVPGWDSIGHLVFINGIESAFDVALPMEASLSTPDLDSLARLIERSLPR